MNCALNTSEFQTFFKGTQKISDDYMKSSFPTLAAPILEAKDGARYIKIVRENSVHAFIDKTNGDVLKPASWKAPAKHARGNIFDDKNGLGSMGPYGPAYLR